MSDNPRIEELRRRVQKDPASSAFAQLAEEYRRAGEHDEAVRVCRTGLAKHPSYLSARVTLGRALIELELYDEAHTELEYVLRSAPENLAAIRGLAEIHQRRGELGEALKQYQTALGIAKHDPELEESVHELTRQLGGTVPQAPTVARGPEKPRPPVARAVAAVPNVDEATGGAALEGTAPEPPPLALETFAPAPDASDPSLSAELEAAADEFTRALEALDAIAIDVPPLPLPADSFDLPPIPVPEEERIVPAGEWEHTGFDAAWEKRNEEPAPAAEATTVPEPPADPDAAAVADLQNWLDNIVIDRGTSKQR